MPPLVASFQRRLTVGRIVSLIFTLLVCFVCIVFVIPIRNVVFYPAIQYAWQEVPTADLLSIEYAQEMNPVGAFNFVVCVEIRSPIISRRDINVSTIMLYPFVQNWNFTMDVIKRRHGNFLPVLSISQKIQNLFLYAVLVEALEAANVKHFFVSGSLLGQVRHGGFVPWDDDIDISVSITQWELVKQVLSCIKTFTLYILENLHWKFRYDRQEYPFIDIFFYQMDENYVWSLTPYIRKTFIYPRKYVFPLTTGLFEGLTVPIPYDSVSIVKRIYDYNWCSAYEGHINAKNRTILQTYPTGFSLERVDCTELLYMYNMSHLAESH